MCNTVMKARRIVWFSNSAESRAVDPTVFIAGVYFVLCHPLILGHLVTVRQKKHHLHSWGGNVCHKIF